MRSSCSPASGRRHVDPATGRRHPARNRGHGLRRSDGQPECEARSGGRRRVRRVRGASGVRRRDHLRPFRPQRGHPFPRQLGVALRRLLDSVAGDADAVDDRRDEIVAALAATAKPYFGDIAEMTYEQLLTRFVELTAVGLGGRYEDGAWLDVTHRDRFVETPATGRGSSGRRRRRRFDSAFVERSSVDDPAGAVATLVRRRRPPRDVPSSRRRPGTSSRCADARASRCRSCPSSTRTCVAGTSPTRSGRPSTRRTTPTGVVIPGPQAVTGITAADEPIADLLVRFEESARRPAHRGRAAVGRSAPSSGPRRSPAARLAALLGVRRSSSTERVRANPVLALAPSRTGCASRDRRSALGADPGDLASTHRRSDSVDARRRPGGPRARPTRGGRREKVVSVARRYGEAAPAARTSRARSGSGTTRPSGRHGGARREHHWAGARGCWSTR